MLKYRFTPYLIIVLIFGAMLSIGVIIIDTYYNHKSSMAIEMYKPVNEDRDVVVRKDKVNRLKYADDNTGIEQPIIEEEKDVINQTIDPISSDIEETEIVEMSDMHKPEKQKELSLSQTQEEDSNSDTDVVNMNGVVLQNKAIDLGNGIIFHPSMVRPISSGASPVIVTSGGRLQQSISELESRNDPTLQPIIDSLRNAANPNIHQDND